MKKYILWTLILTFTGSVGAYAQQNRQRSQAQQRGKQRHRMQLRSINEIDSIVFDLEEYVSQKKEEDRLKELMEQAKLLGSQDKEETIDLNKKFHSGTRRQQGMNPNISLGGDFFIGGSNVDNEHLNTPGDFGYGNNGIFMREIELGLESALDPFTRGKTFISFTEGHLSIEEAYVEILNLPLNMNLRLGIINPEFGPLNRYHDHALPQFDRPRALVSYFGTGNFGGPGVAANFMLPRLLWADASSFEVAAVHGSAPFAFASGSPWLLQGIGHFKNYYDINDDSYFEFSLNSVVGKNPTGINLGENLLTTVNSLALSYKWQPVGRSKYRTFDWKNEFFYVTYQRAGGDIAPSRAFYSSIQNKLGARWWISGRVGYTEKLITAGQNQWDYTLALDFWQSEFVFWRLQYQYNARNYWNVVNENLPSDHSVLLQICWAMGPHRHEAY